MSYYIGIDVGTSSLKLLLTDESGHICNAVSKSYPLEMPRPGWSEQAPENWKRAVFEGIPELLCGFDAGQVVGIGSGGQMHGLVILDKDDSVIRPAILWNDSRTASETDYLNEVIGETRISELTANIAFAGFTAPKLLWLRKHEPDNFRRISRIMLPKDYINFALTGIHSSDYSDASGTLLLDVKHKCWSREMLDICGLRISQMPRLYESYEPVGRILPEIARALGLPESVMVCAGAGDNAAAAVAAGVMGNGGCNISLGTSGTVFISSDHFEAVNNHSIHCFAHADGGWHLMGCMLSAASCLSWLLSGVYHTDDFISEQAGITDDMPGRNHVYFLPYLMGERSPINDTAAKAAFVGLTMGTTRAQMTLAVMEGVAFAIRDIFEVAKALGIEVNRSRICGGGAKSRLWQRILANVLDLDLAYSGAEYGPSLGGAILAMVACGAYPTVQAASKAFETESQLITPEPELAARYEKSYQKFKKIYPSMKMLFKELN